VANRTRLAVAALLVLVIGMPCADSVAWFDPHHLTWGQGFLLVALPPLVSLVLAVVSVIPSRTRPHSSQGDLLGVAVGSLSFWALVGGAAFVGAASIL
jgi:hypothetical protein